MLVQLLKRLVMGVGRDIDRTVTPPLVQSVEAFRVFFLQDVNAFVKERFDCRTMSLWRLGRFREQIPDQTLRQHNGRMNRMWHPTFQCVVDV